LSVSIVTVFVAKENRNIINAIERIVHFFEGELDLKRGVFLKPNIVFPVRDNSGEITRRKVVEAVVEVLRGIDHKVDIVIGEGPAAGTITEENFRVSGYFELARKLKIDIVDIHQSETVPVPWKYGKIRLPRIALEKTYINLPILKRSAAAGFSGAMKNQKGLLRPGLKKGFHRIGLHHPIAYLNQVIQPNLTILDGINAFSDNYFVASQSTCEIDYFIAQVLKIHLPDHVAYSLVGKNGKNNNFFGDNIDNAVIINRLVETSQFKKFINLRLWNNPKACSMCRFTLMRVKKFPFEDLYYTLQMISRLWKYIILGADIVIGSNPQCQNTKNRIICIGNCTKSFAKKHHGIFIPGCPPTAEDMLRYLIKPYKF